MAGRRFLLIVGGYGVVGRRVAARLAPQFPGRVIIAGRRLDRAQALCREIGHGSLARRIDVEDSASIATATEDAALVLACVGQPGRLVLRAAVAQGLAYTDTAPYLVKWRNADAFAAEARRTGARVILGTGLAPGVSSVMAAAGAARAGRLASIESAVLLGAGNETGRDSMTFFLEEASRPFPMLRNGREVHVRPFTEPASIAFPEPLGSRDCYLFPFSDVVLYPRTLGAPAAVSRLALDPPSSAALLAALLALRMPIVVLKAFSAAARLRRNQPATFGLCVTVTGDRGTARYRLGGGDQAAITACAAAEFCRSLAENEITRAGIWCAEEVVPPQPFFAKLAAEGYRVEETFRPASPAGAPAAGAGVGSV